MSPNRAIYKCPVCGYLTHFEKALEAHQRHRRHFPKPEAPVEEEVIIPAEEPEVVKEAETAEEPAVVVKKTRKPRKKAVKESEE